MSFMKGCASSHLEQRNNTDILIVSALPSFPYFPEKIIGELKQACPGEPCPALHDWLGKVDNFEKQLCLYENMIKQ